MYKLVKSVSVFVLLAVIPFALIEGLVREKLFDHVSYTNSVNVDHQLDLLAEDNSYNVVTLGSSEVRWGFSPYYFKEGIVDVQKHDMDVRAFNFGWDGFKPGLTYVLLDRIDLKALFPEMRVLLVGVNITENAAITDSGYQPGVCGALQRPIFNSPFGKDHNLGPTCSEEAMSWQKKLVGLVEKQFAVIRYRASIRSLLLPPDKSDQIQWQSTGLPWAEAGYQPHLSIAEARSNFESSWHRLVAEKQESPERFAALPLENYQRFLREDGFFARWKQYGEDNDVVVMFYSLATNPMLIDLNEMRDGYATHSQMIEQWAQTHDVVFVDLGIKDSYDTDTDFSDHRHLSRYGAPKFSRELGQAFARHPGFVRALAN